MENATSDFDLNLFKQRLNETILWCRHKIAQSTTHTSEILWSLGDPSFKRSNSQYFTFHHPNIPMVEFANKIFVQRSQFVATLPLEARINLEGSLKGGRLVVFNFDGTLSDGAAERSSNDFFDADNVPAWDTWVYFYAL